MPDTWKHSPRLLVLLQQRCCITPKLENACGAIKKTRWLTQLQAIWERLTVMLHHCIYPFFPSLFREDSPSKTTQLRCGFGPCIQFWGYHGTSTTLRVNWRLEISPSLIIPIATRQFALNQFAKIKGLDVIWKNIIDLSLDMWKPNLFWVALTIKSRYAPGSFYRESLLLGPLFLNPYNYWVDDHSLWKITSPHLHPPRNSSLSEEAPFAARVVRARLDPPALPPVFLPRRR